MTPETRKLLGSTKSKITKDENGENVPYLEITEGPFHVNSVRDSQVTVSGFAEFLLIFSNK